MAISFPITGVNNTGANRNPTFTLGTAPAADDVIVVGITVSATAIGQTDHADWTNVAGANVDVDSDAHQTWMCWHRVTSAEASGSTVTWTLTSFLDSSSTWTITATVLRGVDTTTATSGSAGTGFDSANTASPWVIPSVTPADNNSVVIAVVTGDSTETQTTPTGWTLRASTSSATSCYLYSYDTLGTASTPTGTTNVTPSGGDEYASISQAFKAATAAATDANAGTGAVTTTANNPTLAVSPTPGVAAVTSTANNPPPSVAPVAGLATVTVTAYNPTVSTAAATNANAGVATVTVTAYGAPASIGAKPGLAAVTVTAQTPTLTAAPTAGAASVTVTAFAPSRTLAPTAGIATVTVTGRGPTLTAQAVIGLATVTFTGRDPTALAEGTVLGPYGPTLRWHEPAAELGRDPATAIWREPAAIRGS